MLITYNANPAYTPANTSSNITPHLFNNFVSAHFAGCGFKISNKRNRKNPMTYAHQACKLSCKAFATNKNAQSCPTTFELFIVIGFLTKNRPYGRFCKLWLCSVCSSRAELFEISEELQNLCYNIHSNKQE